VLALEVEACFEIPAGDAALSPELCVWLLHFVRKPDTAYMQCPPEDERCDAGNM
jgi:hypothetical protein